MTAPSATSKAIDIELFFALAVHTEKSIREDIGEGERIV
jgi:hypothetical protein